MTQSREEKVRDVLSVGQEIAEMGAAVYAQLLKVEIPENGTCVTHFTEKQAFKLVRTLFYDSLKDAEIL